MKTPEQARAEIFGVVAYRVLGPCTCSIDYTVRKLIAPDCVWHDCHAEMEEALEEAYQKGRKVAQGIVHRIVREVAELPDRTSPQEQPAMMLVTAAELEGIVRGAIDAA